MFDFPSLHPGFTRSPKKPLVTPGSQLFQLISKQTLESSPLHWIGVGTVGQIQRLGFELGVNSIPKFANGIGIDGIVPMTGPIPQCANQIWDLLHFIWDLFHTMNIALGPIPQFQYFIWDLFHSIKIHFGTYSTVWFFFSNTMGRIGPNWGWKKSQSFWDHFHPQLGPIPP